MAEANYTATTPELEYNLRPWGDLIYGTKEQLQAIGLGVGIPFPSEAGETRKKIKVADPRGFTGFINYDSHKGDDVFCAIIKFPERDSPEPKWLPFTFGVKKRESVWWDEFKGTADALSAAGLVQINQLPGQPGMRKVCVTIHPDGTIKTDNKTRREGDKTIKKSGKTRYTVEVKVSDEERERRLGANRKEYDEWEKRMAALPRPKPLHVSGQKAQPQKQKYECFSSPESFRAHAFACIGGMKVFIHFMGGGYELEKFGEVTMKISDESMQEIIDAHDLVIEAIENADIVCVKKKSHLSIVK